MQHVSVDNNRQHVSVNNIMQRVSVDNTRQQVSEDNTGQARVDSNLVGNGEVAPQILHGAASVLAQNALKSSIQAFLHSSILAAKMFSLLIALADVFALSDKH